MKNKDENKQEMYDFSLEDFEIDNRNEFSRKWCGKNTMTRDIVKVLELDVGWMERTIIEQPDRYRMKTWDHPMSLEERESLGYDKIGFEMVDGGVD